MTTWERVTYQLPADEEELLSLELWARGAVGVEIRNPVEDEMPSGAIRLVAYYEGDSAADAADPESWTRRGIRRLARERLADRDWLERYRVTARPFDVGRRLRIDPGDPPRDATAASERILLRVPARRAFGTGSHESTRLLLEWLEEIELADRRVLDVGTGSGILALAARALGADSVVALDVDPVAVFVARDTARSNDVRLPLLAGTVDCLGGRRFDLILLNILPYRWLDGLDGVARCLATGGEALLSGASVDDEALLDRRLRAAGWHCVERRSDGEWRAMRVGMSGEVAS